MDEDHQVSGWLHHILRRRLMQFLAIAEDGIYIALAFLFALSAIAVIVSFLWTVRFTSYMTFIESSLDHFLIVFMLIELMHTTVLYLKTHRFRHEPFLMVGMIAGIRAILILSAHLTVIDESTKLPYIYELVATALVVLVLAVSMRITRVRPSERVSDDSTR
ncbi:MAG: phosphate-starvation-inducible PsiE family protein [Firmicutes bacterium]|nr:phosphate-starvation-inducible PsiE family protein [Bacillota bacterium]